MTGQACNEGLAGVGLSGKDHISEVQRLMAEMGRWSPRHPRLAMVGHGGLVFVVAAEGQTDERVEDYSNQVCGKQQGVLPFSFANFSGGQNGRRSHESLERLSQHHARED